jgi:TRAP-type C4-dicarboxylate transport system permease small subunit
MSDQPPAARSPKGSFGELLFVRLPHLIMGTLLFLAVAINLGNVVGRYGFGAAIFWAEEIMIYMVIWSVFLGGVAIAYRGEHINMDLISSKLGGASRVVLNTTITVLFISGALFVIVQSFRVVSLHLRTGTVSVAAGVPMYIPHSALLIGFVLMLLAVLVRLRAYLTGKFDGDA